jgi:hypothetical protein
MVADTTLISAFAVKHGIFLSVPLFILSICETAAWGVQGTALSRGEYSQTSCIFVLANCTPKIDLGVRK